MGIYNCAIEKDCFVIAQWAGNDKKQFVSVVTSARDIRAKNGNVWGPTVLLPEDEALLMAENIIKMIKEKREAAQ
jgi:hypothetical protein